MTTDTLPIAVAAKRRQERVVCTRPCGNRLCGGTLGYVHVVPIWVRHVLRFPHGWREIGGIWGPDKRTWEAIQRALDAARGVEAISRVWKALEQGSLAQQRKAVGVVIDTGGHAYQAFPTPDKYPTYARCVTCMCAKPPRSAVNELTYEQLRLDVLTEGVDSGDRAAMSTPTEDAGWLDVVLENVGLPHTGYPRYSYAPSRFAQPPDPRDMIETAAAVIAERCPHTAGWWTELARWAAKADDGACDRCVHQLYLFCDRHPAEVARFAHDFLESRKRRGR